MWSPPSPKKLEESKALQLYGGKAHTARELQLTPAIRPAGKHGKDPLYIGLPNYGNSCYQNATLQSLLGLCPFLNDMIALHSGSESDQCRTLHAVAKLMVFRQKALSNGVSSHLSDLRAVLGDIDPAFRGTEMQDANEFLLRLLDTIKDETDARQPSANPGSEVPTLQDALRLSMQPERRELLCQHCRHGECLVTPKVSQLPRTLILQLNRFFFLGDESQKIQANVSILKFLSLNEYVSGDVKRPPEWRYKKSLLRNLSDIQEQAGLERPPVPLLPPPAPAPLSPTPAPAPAAAFPAAAAIPTRTPPPVREPTPRAAAKALQPLLAALLPPAAGELVARDAEPDSWPARSSTEEEEDSELQGTIAKAQEEGESEDLAAEQRHLSEFRAEDDQSRRSLDLAGDNNYRLVGVVSHRGGATHSGHYVADVYSIGHEHWFHYDDRSVSCVQRAGVERARRQPPDRQKRLHLFYLHVGPARCQPLRHWVMGGAAPSRPRLRRHPSRGRNPRGRSKTARRPVGTGR
ncbi:Ubiquitin carboxyl-terminal hydrolase 37 [Amphibalanus amphitrite]|uniref:Ubiquitin carboxyl-terminal hydrolase 37 n=1 Tax=Amphibalanus amphitrite TaxID=1232801 RepID=A0A6A4VQW5_AMPAM|nr:Ubiquitin carboxyl-terminal hydrolase 37 [Amphibalanus amphitrite]